jgi:hypothetical protein
MSKATRAAKRTIAGLQNAAAGVGTRRSFWDWWDDVEPVWLGRARYRLRDLRYWFLYRLTRKHRYHIVRTGLPPGYYDEDTRMLHACMACLCRYIEASGGADSLDAWSAELRAMSVRSEKFPGEHEHNVRQAARQEEAVAIYRWWTIGKPEDEKRQEELLGVWGESHGTLGYEERRETLSAIEVKIAEDEQAMLRRLIDIRPSLWT